MLSYVGNDAACCVSRKVYKCARIGEVLANDFSLCSLHIAHGAILIMCLPAQFIFAGNACPATGFSLHCGAPLRSQGEQ